ncbi:myristoylated alanine-rich C-kinase substrate-like [Panicum virgatum]|uniref:myristoylated alanine-rich C-kinase substrate-like n=1 Tax=Panicum virgatum TaxID=38727 RepID=UPI0019D61330|nr:myristoylated alanine-rich C-kinase substrate-like [Panicum virgatum]
MPESTEEEDNSTGGVDFSESDDFEVVTAVSPPPAPQRASVEASASMLGKRRLAPAMLGEGRLAPATLEKAPAADPPTPATGRGSPVTAMDQKSPEPAAGRGSPALAAGQRSPTLAVRRDSATPAAGQGLPAPVAGRMFAARAETLGLTAPRVQGDRGATPLGLLLGSGSVPRGQRSGKSPVDSLLSPAWSSHRAATKDSVHLALTKALKNRARAMPHSAPQPPSGGSQTLEAAAATFREAVARGAQLAQKARAQEGENDADQSGAAAAARADAEEEASQGGMEDTARPDAEVEPGQGDAEDAARPEAGDNAGRGGPGDAAQPGAARGGGETGRNALEHPTSQEKGETLAPEPTRAGVEGTTAAAMAQTAPVVQVPVEETPAAALSAEASSAAEAPTAVGTPAEGPRGAIIAAAAVASASEGGADIWVPRRSVREGTLAVVKPGIPLRPQRADRDRGLGGI